MRLEGRDSGPSFFLDIQNEPSLAQPMVLSLEQEAWLALIRQMQGH